ncbi:EAL domain-containing response regulator [Thalassotalea sp. PLHSN55]|uniref:EAL domain-containing response regulator n=1 Tax=Thalassotalea sp. PLHSN55 TaxID=3435888 RepID=UPI003F82820B
MSGKDYSWLNVLLVDDSVSILNYVSEVLNKVYDITSIFTASSAVEATQIIRKTNNINLVFLDLNMPNVDGIQLLEQISQLKYKGYLVIMSGVSIRIISSVELLAKKYQLNYIGTLLKPMHESDFHPIFQKIGLNKTHYSAAESLKNYEIIRAIKNDDIEVLYQPQVELITRTFVGVEALCRMKHPRLGTVSPDQFIDKAEESDLIVHITMAVFKKSMHNWRKWHQMGLHIKLSVNASPIALEQPEFADVILHLLQEFSMPADMLCIEVTESVLADNPIQELVNLNRLHMKGVEIALDDFGKENSTVERLQKLPLNYLKLDKSYFIDHKETIGQLSLINTSLSLASKLNIKTVAEGVENSEVMKLVTEIGCDFAQGYYIARPISAKEIIPWAKQWNSQT